MDVAEAYRTEAPDNLEWLLNKAFANLRKTDWITFTSSSSVRNTIAAVGTERVRNVRAATIGPVTSATLREFGIEPAAEASIYTADGVVEAILKVG